MGCDELKGLGIPVPSMDWTIMDLEQALLKFKSVCALIIKNPASRHIINGPDENLIWQVEYKDW